jgi:hypothetical protein
MKALMLDNETLGLQPTTCAHQIGFCAADLFTGEYLIPPTNLYVTPLPEQKVDFETVVWWMRQSDAARASVFPNGAPRIAAAAAFAILQSAYNRLGGEEAGATVWASPAMFDLPILTHAFGLARPDLKEAKPWPYYMERDLMTLYKMLDPEKKLKPTNPVEHDAASDAKAQMDHLIAIFQANSTLLQGAK